MPIQPSRFSTPLIVLVLLLIAGLTLGCNFPLLQNQDLAGLDYTVTVPAEVKAGDDFEISITVTNNGRNTIMVDQISLPRALLQAVTVNRIDPVSTAQADYKLQTGYTFTLIQEPGTGTTVTFYMTARIAGDYSGEVTVAMGTLKKSTALQIEVLAAESVQNTPQVTLSAGVPYRSVVEIIAEVEVNGKVREGWRGSGTIVSADGLILTNAHVVLNDGPYIVRQLLIAITEKADAPPVASYYADIVQADVELDLAVIRIARDLNGKPVDKSTLNLPAVPLGDSNALQLGDSLTILGYPGIGGETITLTRGDVSGFTAEPAYGNRAYIKTSATIAGGNSGGLALNSSGQIIGVPTQAGSGGRGEVVDCRALADTNGDGMVDSRDTCIPIGGFINAIRPIQLALPLIEAARAGEVKIVAPTLIADGVIGSRFSPSGTVLLEDDFANSSGFWYTGSFTDDAGTSIGRAQYANGQLELTVDPANYWIYTEYGRRSFSDVQISVNASVLQTSGMGEYGIVCNLQDDGSFYALTISEDGYFNISIYYQSDWYYLVDWTYTDLIKPGAPATITATCADGRLALAYNDVLLTEVEDTTYQSGYAGLYIGTFDAPYFTIGFDDFIVRQQ